MASAAAMDVMAMTPSENTRRWLLLRYAQRIQHHLELNLSSEVDKETLLAERKR